jgi:hypothetical protein
MGQKMVCFGSLRLTRSRQARQDESIEVMYRFYPVVIFYAYALESSASSSKSLPASVKALLRFRALLQCVLSSTAASWLLLRLAHARCVLPTPRCVLCRLTALPHPPDHQPLRGNGLSHHTPSAMASRQSLLLSSTELCRTRASCLWPPYSRVRTPPIPLRDD